jgi:hypothetical protein
MEDFDPTNVMFMPNGLEKNIRIKLVIIDECSMIDLIFIILFWN